MKLIILSIIIVINFVYFVKCGADLDRCASQCQVIYDCLYQNNGNNKDIPIWPLLNNKQPKITKCYCTRKEEYKTCMDCYYKFKPADNPPKEKINGQCNAMLGQQPSASVPAVTSTNPGTVPTASPNTALTPNGVTPANNNTTQTINNPNTNNQSIQSESNINSKGKIYSL